MFGLSAAEAVKGSENEIKKRRKRCFINGRVLAFSYARQEKDLQKKSGKPHCAFVVSQRPF
ncbi:MAG: hypothetical protein ACJAT6_001154 [Akkermansiaceae bacterium]|jgi:hypothetical protein|tara:strand:- start:7925 stop:8107 length:183 start_codon:yes stop_codon:yes gene_type:complete